MKKVICLYRFSPTEQEAGKPDINTQRRECLDFISQMKNWTFYGERIEECEPSNDTSVNMKDSIVKIRKKAERNEFDVLLVYSFDRLGSAEVEVPLIENWFMKNGIEIWSVLEGRKDPITQDEWKKYFDRFLLGKGDGEKPSERI